MSSEINYSGLKSFDGTISDAEFNALVDITRSITLQSGVDYRVRRTLTGTVLDPITSPLASATCPFDVSIAPVSGDPTSITITVAAGTVNQLLPSNNFTSFTAALSDITIVKARAVSDGTTITSCSLVVDTSAANAQTPTSFALPTSIDIVVAVVVNGVAYRQIDCGSITLAGQQQYITDTGSAAAPGELTYIPYYTWVMQ